MNITQSIAVAAATVAATVALVGCASNYQTKAACQDAVDETTTEAALKTSLLTDASCP